MILIASWAGIGIVGLFFPGYQGTEFSPYTFSSREFETGRWLGKTVVQPAVLACPQEISKHLTNATRTDGVERWDLVEYSRGIRSGKILEASVLMTAFETRNPENGLFWESWSKKHPDLAKILWPAIQQLAIHRSYFAMPELFRIATTNPSTTELKNAIEAISMQAGLDQGERHVAKKEFPEARIAVEWAKTFGNSPKLDALEKSVRAGFATLSKSSE